MFSLIQSFLKSKKNILTSPKTYLCILALILCVLFSNVLLANSEVKFPNIESDNKTMNTVVDKMLAQIDNNKKRLDIGRGFVNEVINNNNRLDYYDLYIKLARNKGYIVTSYYDYITHYMNTNKKVLILRHDIDVATPGTLKMLDIEVKNHVKATYYFRWATFDKSVIDKIVKAGGEVGLHYETLATYSIEHRQNYVTKADIIKCRDILKKEIKDFKEESGIDIKTISSHGNPINKTLGVPNYVILEGQKYSDYGVVEETYDSNILKNYISSYICDDDLSINDGFAYKADPIDSIEENKKVIEFLSHPHHWYLSKLRIGYLYLELKTGFIKY